MQPARSVGIFVCSWKLSLDDGSCDLLLKKPKNQTEKITQTAKNPSPTTKKMQQKTQTCWGIRSVSLMDTELCPLRRAARLGKGVQHSTDKHIETKLQGGSTRPGLRSSPGLWMMISPPWLCICHLLLRIALPYKLSQWLQWVFGSDSVSQLAVRGVTLTVYITGGSGPCSPLCS